MYIEEEALPFRTDVPSYVRYEPNILVHQFCTIEDTFELNFRDLGDPDSKIWFLIDIYDDYYVTDNNKWFYVYTDEDFVAETVHYYASRSPTQTEEPYVNKFSYVTPPLYEFYQTAIQRGIDEFLKNFNSKKKN